MNDFEKERKWHHYFLQIAKVVSTASKDPSTKCGAVIVDKKRRIVSTGYNGFPKGDKDFEHEYLDRELKYQKVVHAEINGILFAKCDLEGFTLYTWPLLPCTNCAKHIAQTGISLCVAPKIPKSKIERWGEDIKLTKERFTQWGIGFLEL